MGRPINLLIVEDSEDDALLLVRELERSGYNPTFERVETAEAVRAALSGQPWDIVFADYTMPHLRGTDALEILKQIDLDIPFIFVSGTIGEDTAVAAMKAGAHDYIMKGNLKRLAPAVERELREAEIRRERRRIQEERDRLSEEIKKRAEELERANRVKNEFLGVMSHELKTPLNVIMGYTRLIHNRMLGEINRQQEQALRKNLRYCDDLLAMMNDILEVTRFEAGHVQSESHRLNLKELLDDLKSGYDVPLDKEVTLVWDYPPTLPVIKTDGRKLRHILQNLINNAIKFTEQGRVAISARYASEAQSVEFRVADTGIGIPREQILFIFDMFRQLNSSDARCYGGAGLGLYIAKSFAEVLGGTIEVQSELGEGSSFTLRLPLEAPVGSGEPDQRSIIRGVAAHISDPTRKALKQQAAELEKKARLLSSLHAVTAAVSRSLDLELILQEFLEKLTETLVLESARIFILDERTRELQLRAHRGVGGDLAQVEPYRIGEGIIGKVFERGEMLVSEGMQTDPEFRQMARQGLALKAGFHAAAWFPIKIKQKILGVVNVLGYRPHQFAPEELELIASMANQMGVAIENAKLFEEVAEKSKGLEALIKINRDVASLLDRRDLLPHIAEEARRILRVDSVSIHLIEGDLLVRAGYAGAEDIFALPANLRLGESMPGKIVAEKRVIAVRDIGRDHRIIEQDRETMRKAGYRSFLGVPLRVGSRAIGAINLYSKEEREFRDEELSLMAGFADQAAIAVENADLFAEVRSKTSDLEKAIKVKDEFLRVMSHELRTPLNVIIGYAGMIQDRMLGRINRRQERALGEVLRHSRDLLAMITNILHATAVEAEGVKLERDLVDLCDFLDRLRLTYDVPMAKELTLLWEYAPNLPVINTDGEKLKHILQNLINNAIKFTEKGRVMISARYFYDAKTVEFKVADTGPGIPEETLPFIFEKFRQADSSETRSYGGVGLGLYFVNKFTEVLGGRVQVESEPGRGSSFTVTIPDKRSEA